MDHTYKVTITGHETQPTGKIAYTLQVQDENNHKTKISKLRYSEFKQIHEEIEQVVSKFKLHITLPQFPKRKFFGSTNKSEQAVLERQKQLVHYLNQLLQLQKLNALDVMRKYYIPDPSDNTHSTPQELNMQICIDRYTLVDDAVIYYVRLRDLNCHQEWVYKARFSELRNLHEALVEAKVKNLPNFPKKKLFGSTNQSPDDIQKRREELEKYFNQIFNVKEVLNSDTIRYFIEESRKEAQKQKDFQAMRKKNNV